MILCDCQDCGDNYVDDCIVFSDNMEAHREDLKHVLGRLPAAGFTLRGSKCFFGKSKVSHLGFDYTGGGIASTEERIRAVTEWPIPSSTKEVRSFLGLVNFYQHFVPRFADVAAPLTNLTGSKTTFLFGRRSTREHLTTHNNPSSLLQSLTTPGILTSSSSPLMPQI